MLDYFLGLDELLFRFLNGLNNETWDKIMSITTEKKTWFPFYGLTIFFLIKKYKKEGFFLILGLVIVVILSDQFSSSFCKPFFARLRPCHQLINIHIVNSCGGQYGFISSHAANTFGLAFFLFLLFKKNYPNSRYTLLVWAAFVSYSRIYVGVHYPLDILVGALSGILWAWLIFKAWMIVPLFNK